MTTRTDIIEAIRLVDARLDGLQTRILEDGDRPLPEGTWRVRDALSHLAARANGVERVLMRLRAHEAGTPIAQPLSIDEINAGQVEERTSLGAADLLALDPPFGPLGHVSNDELKFMRRHFLGPDPWLEPRTYRRDETDGDHLDAELRRTARERLGRVSGEEALERVAAGGERLLQNGADRRRQTGKRRRRLAIGAHKRGAGALWRDA